MLSVNSISVAYETQQVLKNVSFSVQPGEILCVIGPNGVGKSTLIRAMSGIVPLQSGKIEFRGQDINQLSNLEKAKLMAVVPQINALPPAFTAWEMVLLGRTPHLNWLGQTSHSDKEITRAAMERTRTLNLADRRLGETSGGEQQRLLLARALAQSTPILMLDEPTAHLDLKYQINLLNSIRKLTNEDQLTVLITLHDLNLVARYADKVALLVDEELRAYGSPEDVLTPSLLTEAYQVPIQVVPNPQNGTSFIGPTVS